MSAQTESETETLAAKAVMKAARIHSFGGPDAVRFEEIPRPEPKPSEVLIRVHAAGVNPADYKLREGRMGQLPLPATLGMDFSGTVAALGKGVTRWRIGDAVFGTALGSFAEYRTAAQDALAAKPEGLDHIHAAALPVAGLTAWKCLFEAAGLQAGQKALIHGGSGGVGGFAVQLAKLKGAYVAATASTAHQDYLRELGADLAIDYSKTRFEDLVRDADVVLDTQGGDVQVRSFRALKRGGVLVSIVQPPNPEQAAEYGIRAELVVNRMNPEALAEIGGLAAAGKLRVEIEEVLPLAEVRAAMDKVQDGHRRGKIVLRAS